MSRTRTRECEECGREFTYIIGRGMDRKYCSKECSLVVQGKRRADLKQNAASCRIDGCTKPAVRVGAGLCEMHYMRLRRVGTVKGYQPAETIEHTHGYVLRRAPDHPLTQRHSGNYEYEHRVVFYDNYGEGPFRCHWCGKRVTWENMHVDHMNGTRNDNDINNLVPSCPKCNQKRAQQRMTRTMREKYANYIEFNGERLTEGQWAERVGVSHSSLRYRLKAGWSLERALTEPRGKTGPCRAVV